MIRLTEEKLLRFQKSVCDILEKDYFSKTDGWTITDSVVRKNNNVRFHGINIKKEDEKKVPIFYIDEYAECGYTEEATAHSIYGICKKERANVENLGQADADMFLKYDSIKDRICHKVINRKMNQELLKDAPHIPLTDDLALVFYIQVGKNATCLINYRLADIWGIADNIEQRLYGVSERNTERLHPVSFLSMKDALKGLMGEELEQIIPMYVLTNEDKLYGATTMLYGKGGCLQDCMEQIRQESKMDFDSVYIIPSSIHEVLLIPDMPFTDKEELKMMVMEVNRTQLKPEDILSDNIFHYGKEEGLVQITHSQMQIER